MSALPQQTPNLHVCGIDCPCTDPVPAPAAWGPTGSLTVVEVWETPTGRREQVWHGLHPDSALGILHACEDEPDEDFCGAYATDRDGTRWVVRGGEWEAEAGEPDGCDCGRGDCFMCGDDRGRAA